MDLATFHELLTPRGQAAILTAAAVQPTEATFLTAFEKLRKQYPATLAKSALETVLLRHRARVKFAAAGRMYFTRESLEQSSGELVARHRARRLVPFEVVADTCCGVGGDTIALAAAGLTVHAIESDPLRVAMAHANATALHLADRVYLHEGDALTHPLPGVRAAFADPSRRADGRRHLDPENYTPPLSALRGRFEPDFPLGVKIAPGVPWSDLTRMSAEVEFVSVSGELKEGVLWFGPLRTTARRATVLPDGATLAAEEPLALPSITTAKEYVFDPDPAVVRAGLTGALAAELGLTPIDYSVATLTGSTLVRSPFLTAFRIELAERFHAGRLRDHLRTHKVGRVTPLNRGSVIDVEEMMKKLKLEGSEHRVVILTRMAGEPAMIVGERMERRC